MEFCEDLKFRLIFKRKGFEEVLEEFQRKVQGNESISLQQIREVVRESPFELDEEQALLFARFSVEDNTQSRVVFDQEQRIELEVLKSILNFLLGKYEIYDPETMEKTLQEMNQKLLPKKQQILDGFTRMMKIKGDYATLSEIKMNLLSNDIAFTPKEYQILQIKLFKYEQSLRNLPFRNIFD